MGVSAFTQNPMFSGLMWELFHNSEVLGLLEGLEYNVTTTKTPRPYAVGETFSRVQSVIGDLRNPEWLFYGAADNTRFPECAVVAPLQEPNSKLSPTKIALIAGGSVILLVVIYCFFKLRAKSTKPKASASIEYKYKSLSNQRVALEY